jgi:competence protein ComEA
MLAAAAGLLVGSIVATSRVSAQPAQPAAPQDDKATQAFLKLCSDCHEPDRIVESRRTRGGWEEVIEKMIEKGASGTDQEFELVLQYLLRNIGMVNMNQDTAEDIALVSGLSKKDADAVVAYRKANGNFKNYDALTKVPGIDVKALDEHKAGISF